MLKKLNTHEQLTDAANLLHLAQQYWEALHGFRENRAITRNWTMGKQWNDMIEWVDDCCMVQRTTEAEYLKSHGSYPLQQNIMHMQLNNLIGQYRSNTTTTMVLLRNKTDAKIEEMLNNAIMSVLDVNNAQDMDAAMLREFLISGCCMQKLTWEYMHERDTFDVRIRNVNPAMMFVNADITDIRGIDLTCIGEIRDVDINLLLCNKDICRTRDDADTIRHWYNTTKEKYRNYYNGNALDTENVDSMSFLLANDLTLCRVIEIWYLENRDGVFVYDNLTGERGFTNKTIEEIVDINTNRILVGLRNGEKEEDIPVMQYERRIEQKWKCKWLTPCGHVLLSGESPYKHQSHPYTIKLHPLIDGEVHGYMFNSIDQQRAINRSMIQVDKTMRMMSKIVVPASALEGSSRTRFEKEMLHAEKVMVIPDRKVGGEDNTPHQLFGNINSSILQYFLGMQQNLIDQVSGIHGAIQGQTPQSGTSGKLYQQESANATLNTRDVIAAFSSFLEQRNRKLLQLLMQFYENKRPIMSFKWDNRVTTLYDHTAVRDADVEVKVIQSHDTPVYRAMQDDNLMEYIKLGVIPPMLGLKHMSIPQIQEIVQEMEQEQQKQQEAQQQMLAAQQQQQEAAQAPPPPTEEQQQQQ